MKNKLIKIKEWLKHGSNIEDTLMIIGLFIIVATTFYINAIIGFYLLGALLIIIPPILYNLTRKRGD